ncbi:hypothetical protein LTR97_003563 [Elasticomyces elasticus]|uniref:Bulb-type lectin domain-containing protein n=1 Tax=Elasticomyces elasticus TaxID=574655 RepID=A0AAN8A3R3_9PEZI|nr:hypothetical protein LTR97_003563 [Elasticomyces elasticus]
MLRLFSIAAAALLAISGVAARYDGDDEYDEEDGGLEKRATISPIMDGRNFPDPAIIKVADGWHAFATNLKKDGTWIHVPMAKSPDYKKWTYRDGVDAMPKLAAWVDPDSPRAHSKKLEGPYVDNLKEPWVCPYANGGAIDPAGYTNKDGTRWVVYKIDGNAVGHGGSCNNNVEPIVSTPIMLQQVNAADGHTKIGSPIQLIKNDKADGPVVEAPALTYLGGKYVLFFSSNCFATTLYDVSYATADHIKGPYTKYGPLFVTGTLGMVSPGGLDIAMNGDHAIWHGATSNGRGSYTALLSMKGNQVVASTLS